MHDIKLALSGYRLTTAEILYHLPDHPRLLQSFIWQELDIAPKYPVLSKFLKFWETSLDGMETTGWPVMTILRGRTVMRDHALVEAGQGEAVRFGETLERA